MKKLKDFYIRNSQNLVRNIIMRLSMAVLVVTTTEKTITFFGRGNNPNIFKFTKSESLILNIFSTQGILFSLIALFGLFIIDFYFQKKNARISK